MDLYRPIKKKTPLIILITAFNFKDKATQMLLYKCYNICHFSNIYGWFSVHFHFVVINRKICNQTFLAYEKGATVFNMTWPFCIIYNFYFGQRLSCNICLNHNKSYMSQVCL